MRPAAASLAFAAASLFDFRSSFKASRSPNTLPSPGIRCLLSLRKIVFSTLPGDDFAQRSPTINVRAEKFVISRLLLCDIIVGVLNAEEHSLWKE